MASEISFSDMQNLVRLFDPQRDKGDSDEDLDAPSSAQVSGTEKKAAREKKDPKDNPYAKITDDGDKKELEKECNLMNEEDLEAAIVSSSDWKKTPKWDISYRQGVSASDVFLQMGNKNPSTSSCEDMIITIHLPGERMQNMDTKVEKKSLRVESPNYCLKIPLPQPVDPQRGNARWDSDQDKLVMTLKMDREFDFVNF